MRAQTASSEPSKSNLLALKNMLTKEITTEEESYILGMPLLHFNVSLDLKKLLNQELVTLKQPTLKLVTLKHQN